MRASSVEYHAPARFDDLLECFVRVSRLGRTSATYECVAVRLPDDDAHGDGDARRVVLVDVAIAPPRADPRAGPCPDPRLRGRRPRRVTRHAGAPARGRRAGAARLPLPHTPCSCRSAGASSLVSGIRSPERGTPRPAPALSLGRGTRRASRGRGRPHRRGRARPRRGRSSRRGRRGACCRRASRGPRGSRPSGARKRTTCGPPSSQTAVSPSIAKPLDPRRARPRASSGAPGRRRGPGTG